MSVSKDERASIYYYHSSTETVAEVTELILKNYPQGISEVGYCDTGALEMITRSNPKAIRRYSHGYVV